jgi:hypothetical protein
MSYLVDSDPELDFCSSAFEYFMKLSIVKIITSLLKLPVRAYRMIGDVEDVKAQMQLILAEKNKLVRYGFYNGERTVFFHNRRQGNNLIRSLIEGDDPVMIARHGHVELIAAANYEITNTIPNMHELHINAGFFPEDQELAKRWAELYLNCLRELDCMCEWNFRYGRFVEAENLFGKYHPNSQLISNLGVLTPFFEDLPWTKSLEGRRVLVVHPFEKSIRNQYARREHLFENPGILPVFSSLSTVKAIQTAAGTTDPRFPTWFEAYRFMCDEIDKNDFEIALIGAGAYGLPLAAHVKRSGRKAIHVGGGLQLLFGIYGARWSSDDHAPIRSLINEHWVRPLPEERPDAADRVEGGCYW